MGCMLVLACLASWLAVAPAHAHGDAKAQHGGVVQMAHDVGFELVAGEGEAALYLTDHGQPLATQGVSGKLMVLQGGKKTEAALAPAGANKLSAKGLTLQSGAKVVAALAGVAGKAVTVRFVMP
jgi:hypothetical protein